MQKRVTLPQSVVTRAELELWSDIEGKVPFGAWQELLMRLIKEWLAQTDAARAARGEGK